MSRTRKLLGAGALAAVVAAGGTAFTAGNNMPAGITKGYGTQSISGVTAESITYNTTSTKDTITSVDLVLTGDTTAKTIQIAFNSDTPATCSGSGTFDSVDDNTSYSCAVSQSVSTATQFALIAE